MELSARVDPMGPVFISYHRESSAGHADRLKRALWAAGVPVWQDLDDLRPGDIASRIREATAQGLSGVIFIVSAGTESSKWMPRELDLFASLAKDPLFMAAFAITVPGGNDGCDLHAVERTFDASCHPFIGHLRYPFVDGDGSRIARRFARHRIEALRTLSAQRDVVSIDIQSRLPFAAFSAPATLTIRTMPPAHGRAPAGEDLAAYATAMCHLPELVTRARPTEVLVHGGGHLSMAFALGTALNRRLFGPPRVRFVVEDQHSTRWPDVTDFDAADDHPEVVSEPLQTDQPLTGPSRHAAVFVDFNAEEPQPGFAAYVGGHQARYGRASTIRFACRRLVQPSEIGRLAATVNRHLRKLGANELDLFLMGSFPFAVLLGRWINVLTINLFEYADRTYVPALVAHPGDGTIVTMGTA